MNTNPMKIPNSCRSFKEAAEKPRRQVFADPLVNPLLEEMRRLESSLHREETQVAERRLPFGSILRLEREKEDSSKKTLRVLLDPLRFRAWREKLSPAGLVYINSCGIEVIRHPENGRWALYFDGSELFLREDVGEIYEAMRLEKRETIGGLEEIVRLK